MSRGAASAGDARWFLTPYAVAVGVLVALPTLLTGYYAFTDHTGLADPRFNGLANVRRLLDDETFLDSLRASLALVALAVPLRLLVAAGLGLALAAPVPGSRLARVLAYLPTVMPDVALALVFLWVLNPVYGPLNQLLGALGLPEPIWLSTPWGARTGVVLLLLLPIGEAFVVVLTTRRALNARLYEAAALDGCTPWRSLRSITLPLLAPVLVLLAVRDLVTVLQASFVPGYVLTDGRPGNATLFLPLYIYDQAFEFASLGYAALLTLVLMAMTATAVAVLLLLVRRWRILR